MALTALRLPREGVRRKHLLLPLGLNQSGGHGGMLNCTMALPLNAVVAGSHSRQAALVGMVMPGCDAYA